MDINEKIVAIMTCTIAVIIISNLFKKQQQRKPRRWWCTDLYKKRSGPELLKDLQFQHISGQYKNFCRMSPTDFEYLLNKIGPKISRKETHLRRPISIQDRLVSTFNYY